MLGEHSSCNITMVFTVVGEGMSFGASEIVKNAFDSFSMGFARVV